MQKHLITAIFAAALIVVPGFLAFAQTPRCTIDEFSATPVVDSTDKSATFTIKTSNCDNVTLFGLKSDNAEYGLAVQEDSSVSSGPVSTYRTFTLEANRGGSAIVSKKITLSPNAVATTALQMHIANIFEAISALFDKII